MQYLIEHYDSDPATLKVWASPSVNKEVYPIFKLNGAGMKEAFFEQMNRAGVSIQNIVDMSADTAVHPDYYSYSEFLKGNKPEGSHAMIAVMPV